MSYVLTEQLKKQSNALARKYGKTREQREDIESLCLISSWKADQLKDNRPDAGGYVYESMKNAVVDEHRRLSRIQESPGLPLSFEATSTDPKSIGDFDLVDLRIVLADALQQLPERDHSIMRILAEGGDMQDLADFLGVKRNHARSILCDRRKVWRKLLSQL